MRTLYGLAQSPYTEKARWALDHHAIAYRYQEHVPLFGEVLLRLKVRAAATRGKKATVPLLVDGADVLPTSLEVARYADRIGRGAALFPEDQLVDVLRWADVSDRIVGIGRASALAGLRSNRAAQREALPPFVPPFLRGSLAPTISSISIFLASKHDVPSDTAAEVEKLGPLLEEVRRALGGGSYLLAGLTFADVAVAASLQVLRPRASSSLGPGTRAIWSHEDLAADYEDLLAWRDRLYRQHRGD